MPVIQEFIDLLKKAEAIHRKKNDDYAAVDAPYENFERSAEIASWFKNDIDKPFAVLIGTKLARLATLLNSGAEPNNESVADTFLDLFVYSGLWAAHNSKPTSRKIGWYAIGNRAAYETVQSLLDLPLLGSIPYGAVYFVITTNKFYRSGYDKWEEVPAPSKPDLG